MEEGSNVITLQESQFMYWNVTVFDCREYRTSQSIVVAVIRGTDSSSPVKQDK
jgi:hypothetical protein